MPRILTIIALLFATPAWATKYLSCQGDLSFREKSVETDFFVEMNENPVTFIFRKETYNECSVSETIYRCSVIKGLEGFGNIRLNRMSLDVRIERWIPNSQSGLNEKFLFEGSCQRAKQQL